MTASSTDHRHQVLDGDLALRFEPGNVFGYIQDLNAYNPSIRSIVDGHLFAQPLGDHFNRFFAQANVQGIYFSINVTFIVLLRAKNRKCKQSQQPEPPILRQPSPRPVSQHSSGLPTSVGTGNSCDNRCDHAMFYREEFSYSQEPFAKSDEG